MDNIIISLSWGYFIYDTIQGYRVNIISETMLIHHFVLLIDLPYILFLDKYSLLLFNIYMIGECTNPLLLIHQNFKSLGLIWLSNIFGYSFCIFFIYFRLFELNLQYYRFLLNKNIPTIIVLSLGLGVYVSLVWIFEIVNKLLKTLNQTF